MGGREREGEQKEEEEKEEGEQEEDRDWLGYNSPQGSGTSSKLYKRG